MVDLLRLQPALLQAVAQGIRGKALVMLLAREALLLGGCDDASVLYQRRSAVVVVGRDADDAHGCLPS